MIEEQKLIMKNIENYGKKYLKHFHKNSVLFSNYKCVSQLTKELNNNCWVSLEYLLHHTFMRGRKDELSEKYYKYTIRKLKEFFNINTTQNREKLNLNYNTFIVNVNQYTIDYENIYNIKNQEEFLKYIFNNDNKLIKLLRNKNNEDKILKNENEHPLNNYKDIIMVLGVLYFVSNIAIKEKKRNITNYFIENINDNKIEDSYNKLKKIKFIGTKIASFYLRNLVFIYKIRNISKDDLIYFLPIDTWIKKVSIKAGIIKNDKINLTKKNINYIRKETVKKCNQASVNPLLFNLGCWYLGSNSFDLLIDLLKKDEINFL